MSVRIYKELGFLPKQQNDSESLGDCVFCGKTNKLSVNINNGLYRCFSAVCGKEGNATQFLWDWWSLQKEENESEGYASWKEHEKERGIPIQIMLDCGIVMWDDHLYIPIFNQGGTEILNLMRFQPENPKVKIKGLHGVDRFLWGLQFYHEQNKTNYLCEGEWDGIALWGQLQGSGGSGFNVFAAPGANIFKDDFCPLFKGKSNKVIFDNDAEGEKGTEKFLKKCGPSSKEVKVIKWLPKFPIKFDIRDFFKAGGDLAGLEEMLEPPTGNTLGKTNAAGQNIPTMEFPVLDENRPSFDSVLEKYKKWLFMTEDLEKAIRLAFTTVIANQIPGDPLWLYIVGPPSSGKTEILNSIGEVEGCVMASSITAQTLISGFPGEGEKDPSLIPKLIGKVFVLKDFTEILKMNSAAKDKIYSQLRGAYDGRVEDRFGNSVGLRSYVGHFGMLAGVTPAIFSDSNATLGERFLLFHLFKTKAGVSIEELILGALENVGDEVQMRSDLIGAAKSFLEYKLSREQIPELDRDYLLRIIGVAQIVAMLRATVDRHQFKGTVNYRPQEELGTRIAKQLKKLMLSAGCLHYPPKAGKDEYDLAVRVALDSCIGFNLEILFELIFHPGQDSMQLAENLGIPLQTLRDHLEDLLMLNCIDKSLAESTGQKGRPQLKYYPSELLSKYFKMAQLDETIKEYITAARTKLKSRKRFDE